MRKNDDIGGILRRWDYESGRSIRKIRTAAGREVLQVRLPLGIEQYEINGRPDGKRPQGCESWFRVFQKKAQTFGREFLLDEKECELLQNEGVLYYYRYLLFFQIGEYALCARDTARNLRLLDFVSRFAPGKESSEGLEQYRPYIVRMNIMARALNLLQDKKDVRAAVRLLRHGVAVIRQLPSLEGNSVFDFERDRSVKSLRDLLRQLEAQLPVSKKDVLKKQMQEAISREDYEKAANLRDQLKKMVGE